MGHDENTVGTGFNFTYIYITPGNTFLFYGSPFTQAVMLPGIKLSWQNLDYTSPVTTAGSTYRDTDYSAIINYRLPGGYTLTSTTRLHAGKSAPGAGSIRSQRVLLDGIDRSRNQRL